MPLTFHRSSILNSFPPPISQQIISGRATYLRKSRLPLFGRFVEASATADCRGPARKLFALVHRRRAQAPGRATFATGALQGVDVQVGVVAATALAGGRGAGAAGRDVTTSRLENGVVEVVGCRQVALGMERL